MSHGDFQSARADLEDATRQSPADPQVCLALTELYARTKEEILRNSSAVRCLALAHAAAGWESQAVIRDYIGKLELANARYPQALAEYREAIRLSPYEESYRFDLAQALLGHEQFPEAVEVLEDARKVFDKSGQIELALGVAYYGQRRFPEAVGAFLRTIELAPDVVQPYVFLGRMIDQAGDRLPEVRRRFASFQTANPDNALAYLLEAKAIAAGGENPAEEERLLRKSIELNDHNGESHYELGVLLETRRNYPEAARELERGIQLQPDSAPSHYHLARVYDRLNRTEAANRERDLHRQLTAREKVTAGMEPTQ